MPEHIVRTGEQRGIGLRSIVIQLIASLDRAAAVWNAMGWAVSLVSCPPES
jgi:hypothetical protein